LDFRTVHDSNGAEAVWSAGSGIGVDNIDMWIGGLDEKQSLFSGLPGSTFECVFRSQMEALRDADRIYYLRETKEWTTRTRSRTARSQC
jgi:hypothetical protein